MRKNFEQQEIFREDFYGLVAHRCYNTLREVTITGKKCLIVVSRNGEKDCQQVQTVKSSG